MRVNIVNQGGTSSGGFDIAGATLTGPLILAADPVTGLEATTKQYVDNAVNSLNAGHITTGTLPVGRLPAFTGGDVESTEGGNSFTLTNTTVTPGTYTKVTVDVKGRILAGSALVAADIPALDWSKITNNKPTTLDGYGITDAVKNTTDNVTGFVTAHAAPTAGVHAATKGYVDGLVSGSSSLAVGDTIRRTSTSTPTGFLRCNGGEVSKTTYAALYAVVGEQYNFNNYLYKANAQPWRQQYSFNSSQSGSLGTWTIGTNVPAAMADALVLVTTNWAYILGNANGSNCYRAPINADGSIGTWATTFVSMPVKHRSAQCVVIKNRVYLIGGTPSSYTNAVSMAILANDGTIGNFTAVNPLVSECSNAAVAVTSKFVYLIGGSNNANNAALLQYAPINADGTLGTWSQKTLGLGYINRHSAVIIRDRVYVIGGRDNLTGNEIAYTYINSDGTLGDNWIRQSFPVPGLFDARIVASQNRVYVIGGQTTSEVASVYSSSINADGSLNGFAYDSTLPRSASGGDVFVTSSRVYYVGGTYYDEEAGTNYQSVQVFYAGFLGGLNDYSVYHGGSAPVANSTTFYLPDTSQIDPNKIYTFIKY